MRRTTEKGLVDVATGGDGQVLASEIYRLSDLTWYKMQDVRRKAVADAQAKGEKLTKEQDREIWKIWGESEGGILWQTRHSDRRYHYCGNGQTYYDMGCSMGRAMLELVK